MPSDDRMWVSKKKRGYREKKNLSWSIKVPGIALENKGKRDMQETVIAMVPKESQLPVPTV